MSEKYTSYDEQVKKFNDTFKVNFSYDNFESHVKKLDAITKGLSVNNKTGSNNTSYRSFLLNLYHQVIENYAEGKLDNINHADLVNEFEKLMVNYRTVNPQNCPDKHGGWKHTADLLGDLREVANKMSDDKADYIKDKYLAGKYPLRRMREEFSVVRANGANVSTEQLSKTMLMARALEKVVKERSAAWKVFHPFRNRAEQRDLKALRTYLDLDQVKKYENFAAATEIANAKPITLANSNIDISMEKHLAKKAEQEKALHGIDDRDSDEKLIGNLIAEMGANKSFDFSYNNPLDEKSEFVDDNSKIEDLNKSARI